MCFGCFLSYSFPDIVHPSYEGCTSITGYFVIKLYHFDSSTLWWIKKRARLCGIRHSFLLERCERWLWFAHVLLECLSFILSVNIFIGRNLPVHQISPNSLRCSHFSALSSGNTLLDRVRKLGVCEKFPFYCKRPNSFVCHLSANIFRKEKFWYITTRVLLKQWNTYLRTTFSPWWKIE